MDASLQLEPGVHVNPRHVEYLQIYQRKFSTSIKSLPTSSLRLDRINRSSGESANPNDTGRVVTTEAVAPKCKRSYKVMPPKRKACLQKRFTGTSTH
jgi:hypothetical protein